MTRRRGLGAQLVQSNALFAVLAVCWAARTLYGAWDVASFAQDSALAKGVGNFTRGDGRARRATTALEDVWAWPESPSVNGTKGEEQVNGTRHYSAANQTGDSAKNTRNDPVIDAVFTYVNGSDPELQKQMKRFGRKVDPSRVRDFGQLRYAMRSAYINAPFIRNFVVVVSNKTTQTPSWLDVNHPRIRVIEHAEIWDDPATLPSMNSHAIEWATMNIPDIAPLYLLFNDDIAIQKPLGLSSIWRGPKMFVLYQAWAAPTRESAVRDAYGKSVAFVYQLYNKKYGRRKQWRVASHVPILLKVEVMRKIRNDFREEIRDMYRKKPFRTNRDMQTQFAYQQYVMHHHPNIVKTDRHAHFVEDLKDSAVNANAKRLRDIRDKPRQYLCMQDKFRGGPSAQVLDQIRGFYEELFPTKAPWETDAVRPSVLWKRKSG